MLAYSGICWHIVTHMNVDISWLMNMLTPIGISVGVKLPNYHNLVPNSVNWYQVYITKVLNIVYYFSKFSCSCTQYTFKQIFMPYV